MKYPASIMESNADRCYICGRSGDLAVHHVIGGPYRAKSTEDGLTVHLCPDCHTNAPYAVHRDAGTMRAMRKDAQAAYEKVHGPGSFFRRYKRRYM